MDGQCIVNGMARAAVFSSLRQRFEPDEQPRHTDGRVADTVGIVTTRRHQSGHGCSISDITIRSIRSWPLVELPAGAEGLHGMNAFMKMIDTLILARKTYEVAKPFGDGLGQRRYRVQATT